MASTIIILLMLLGIYDLYLLFKGRPTVSTIIHRKFNKWVDGFILVGLLVITWWLFGPNGFAPVMVGTIIGHWFWHGD